MPRTRKPSDAPTNRTDLLTPGPQPVTPEALRPPNPQPATAATGQAYGAEGAQLAAQHAMPMGATASGPPADYHNSTLQAAAQQMPFVDLGLSGPSQRPREHILSALNGSSQTAAAVAPQTVSNISETLARLAATEPALADLVNRAREQGL